MVGLELCGRPPAAIISTAVKFGIQLKMSIADELEKLDELRQRGVLSFREFQTLKAKLLNLVDDAKSLSQLDELKSSDDVPQLGLDAVSASQLDENDVSGEVPQLDADVSDEELDLDDQSFRQLDQIQVAEEVPQFDLDVSRSSQFEKIEIPEEIQEEVTQLDSELALGSGDLDQLEKNELLNEVTRLGSQLKEIQGQNEVAQVDRAWERERTKYEVVGKHGYRHVPSKTGSAVAGVVISVAGLFWMILSIGLASRIFILPLFGVAVVIVGVVVSFHSYKKAEEYERARRRYNQRRSKANRKC